MKLFRPVAERREYARHLKSAFPSGYWVEDHEGEAEVAEVPGCEPGGSGFESRTPPHLTVIGSSSTTPVQRDMLESKLRDLSSDTVVVTGGARGAEHAAVLLARQLGLEVREIRPDKSMFGSSAGKVNVEQILCDAIRSPVVLVGDGQRVKEARSWLNRASWGRDVLAL